MATAQGFTDISVLKRRPVGKREWRMSLQEILESERAGMALLRQLRLRHPNDTETLRLVAEAQEEATGRIFSLTELLHYRDDNGQTNGGEA